jgi:hypothetical protein
VHPPASVSISRSHGSRRCAHRRSPSGARLEPPVQRCDLLRGRQRAAARSRCRAQRDARSALAAADCGRRRSKGDACRSHQRGLGRSWPSRATRRRESMTSAGQRARPAPARGRCDASAWDSLVERYTNLLWSVARAHRLDTATRDVVQTTWLRLVENLGRIQDPERLPVARHHRAPESACGSCAAPAARSWAGGRPGHPGRRRRSALDARCWPMSGTARCGAASRSSGALPDAAARAHGCRPARLRRGVEALGMPVGSIGPTRGRCIDSFASSPAQRVRLRAATRGREHTMNESIDTRCWARPTWPPARFGAWLARSTRRHRSLRAGEGGLRPAPARRRARPAGRRLRRRRPSPAVVRGGADARLLSFEADSTCVEVSCGSSSPHPPRPDRAVPRSLGGVVRLEVGDSSMRTCELDRIGGSVRRRPDGPRPAARRAPRRQRRDHQLGQRLNAL